MLVFWKERLVLLANPKTGTSAIEDALGSLATLSLPRPAVLKHTNATVYRTHLQPYFEQSADGAFQVVALMRNPFDWLGSWYRHRQGEGFAGSPLDTSHLSFDAFVEAYLQTPCPEFADVGTQSGFLMQGDRIGVDRIFCYEDMGRFVNFMEDVLDCAIVLPRLNVSPDAALHLTDSHRAALTHVLGDDLALYGRVAAGETA